MDRTKEEQPGGEEKKKDKESTLTPLITTRATPNILAASTDDDTSTESSDTFDTWTLVSDKQKFMEPHAMAKDNDDSRIEILKNSEPDEDEDIENAKKTAEQQHMEDSLKDVTTDDFSDGISIISETESVGRISPHPYVRDHLQDFSTTHNNMDDEILYRLRQETPIVLAKDPAEQQLRRRRRSSATADPTKEEKALQKSFQTVSLPLDMPPLVKRGLQGIFYIGVGLAILALIGKIINPTWQPLAGGKLQSTATSNQLEQKVNDMELQNNLMRAEIDLLNKQVKYLSSFKDPQQQPPQHKGKHKEGKTFKAWSGNGDSLKPVIITKEDLKRPYKCPDGSYVEFANMCMEQRPQNEPSLVDQFGQVVEDMKQQSETFKTFEKVAEELHGFQDNPFEQLDKILSEDKAEAAQPLPTKEFIQNKPIYQSTEDAKQKYQHQHNPKAESKHHHKYDKSHEGKNFHDYSKESFEKFQEDSKKTLEKLRDNSKESFEKLRNNSREKFRKIRDDSKETFKKIRDNSKETFKKIRDNSKEQFEKFKDYTKNHGNFEERKAGKFDNSQESNEKSSKERFNRHKRQNDDKTDNNKDSGEWQEKYMQHREKQRKQNEHKYQNNENWYIKRGDSRETKRSGEKQYR